MNKRLTVAICTHKDYKFYNEQGFVTLVTGADKNKISTIGYRDNTGDNISFKNPNYSELTGLYWLWKNVDSDIKGLFHYRRYLNLGENKPKNIADLDFKFEDIEKVLNNYDLIVPNKVSTTHKSVEKRYKDDHIPSDFDELKKVISEIYPEYYEVAIDIFNGNKFYPYNILIARKEIFDGYCKWLFDILFELEKRIEISSDPYQARVFGFLSERLLMVYIAKNKLRARELKKMEISENGDIYIEPPKFIRSIKKRIEKIRGLFR